MKQDIHPKYFPEATITCACGAVHKIESTREKMTVEICSKCHPFYTGKEKLIDTAGRVEKFKTRRKRAEAAKVPASPGSVGKKIIPTKSGSDNSRPPSKASDLSMHSTQDKSKQKKSSKKITKTVKEPIKKTASRKSLENSKPITGQVVVKNKTTKK